MLANAVQIAWWQAAHLIPRNHGELQNKEELWQEEEKELVFSLACSEQENRQGQENIFVS